VSLCAQCGLSVPGDESLCLWHHNVSGDTWSAANRIWCNFFHRGIPIPRLVEPEEVDYMTSYT